MKFGSLDNGGHVGQSALVRRRPFLSKLWVAAGILLVTSASWWAVAPNWAVHAEADDGKVGGLGSGLGLMVDRDVMWTVTVPFTMLLALVAAVLRPQDARQRSYWAALVAASVLIANLRAPLWSLVAAAVTFALVRDPSRLRRRRGAEVCGSAEPSGAGKSE